MIKLSLARKFTAVLANLSLLLNTFLPFALVIQPVYAQDPQIIVSTIQYDSSAHKLDITTDTSQKIAYQLFYKTDEKIDAIASNDLNQANQSESFYLGTCSSNSVCLSQNISRGILKIESNSKFYSKLFTLENNVLTITKEIESLQSDLTPEEDDFLNNIDTQVLGSTVSNWTFEKVKLNKTYTAPQNDQVKITFTKLPEISGNIKIEEITLTEDQIKQTGSVSNKAYDITSDMVDGTFAYNLSLPIPESSKDKIVEIKFAEDISEIDSAQKVDLVTKTDDTVLAKNLDHFTVFFAVVKTTDKNLVEKEIFKKGETVYINTLVLDLSKTRIVIKNPNGDIVKQFNDTYSPAYQYTYKVLQNDPIGEYSINIGSYQITGGSFWRGYQWDWVWENRVDTFIVESVCGDDFKDTDEQCDNGNLSNADGCSDFCIIENGWECNGNPSLCKDITPPSKPRFTSPTTNITNINAITLKWDGGDDTGSGVKGYIFRYVFNPANGGSPVNWSSGFVNTTAKTRSGSFGHGQGTYMMFVKIIDNAGNESLESDALNITYDSIAPIITVNPYITNDKTPKITGTVDDNSATILVEVNGFNYVATNNGNGTWTLADNVITPNLIDNTYDVIATATDTAGNIGIDLTTDELIIDSVAPNATFQHYIDGVLFTGPIAYTNSLNKLTFTAEYTDTNPSSQLLKDSYVIFDAQSDHSFKFSQNGAKAYCGWRSNPNLVDLYGNPFSLTLQEPFTNCINSLNEGEYYLAHQVYDNAIRQDIPSITQFRDVLGLHFIIDKTAPTSTIDGGGDNETIYSSSWDGSLSGTATDNLSGVAGVQVSIKNESDKYYDGSGFNEDSEKLLDTVYTDSSGTWAYSGLTDPTEDSYTVKSHAIDNAGNIEDTYTLTIVLDKTISEVGISLDPTNPDASNGWYKTQPEVTLTHTDANFDKIQYQWDSQSDSGWNTYSDSFKLTTEGAHILYYRAIDKATNISPVGVKNIKWDKTDLEFGPQNISANPNPTSGSTSKISWEKAKDNDGIDHYEIQWNLNDSTNPLSYSKTVDGNTFETEIDKLIEGRWTVKVIAFDASGKSKDNSIDLIVDRTGPSAPNLTLTGTGTGTASLSWNTIPDAKDYIIWYGNTPGTYLYGARVGNITSYTVQGIGAGNYYFVVKAVDAAQNQSGNSNEVNTGTIAGAAGIEPGQPAQGFTPEVLGTNTQNDESLNETSPKIDQSQNTGNILGESTSTCSGNLLPILFLIALFVNILFIRRFSAHWIVLLLITVSTGLFDYIISKNSCSLGQKWLSNYFWIGSILSFLIPLFSSKKQNN